MMCSSNEASIAHYSTRPLFQHRQQHCPGHIRFTPLAGDEKTSLRKPENVRAKVAHF